MFLYETPFGTFATEIEAIESFIGRGDLDPDACIKKVPINRDEVSWVSEYGLRQKLSRPVTVY